VKSVKGEFIETPQLTSFCHGSIHGAIIYELTHPVMFPSFAFLGFFSCRLSSLLSAMERSRDFSPFLFFLQVRSSFF